MSIWSPWCEPAGLPVTDEQWDLFDVVILGDVDAGVWRPGQLDGLARFVRRGGGLVMLGGARTFAAGGYGDTPLAATLPVRCGRPAPPYDPAPFVPRLTADGMANPLTSFLAALLPGPAGHAPTTPLPELAGLVRTDGLTGGAVALAVHPTSRQVVLATRRVGEGRSMAFTAFAVWRWRLQPAGRGHGSPYGRFWRQAVRYLAAAETDAAGPMPQILGRVNRPHVDVGESIQLTAYTRRFEPAVVTAEVRAGDTVLATVPLVAGAESGRFTAQYAPAAGGSLVLRFIASDSAGREVATDDLPLAVLAGGGEQDRLARDDALLADVARRSGGGSGDLSRLAELVGLMVRRADRGRTAEAPTLIRLHNLPAGLAAMVALLTVEWILRRRWQLR